MDVNRRQGRDGHQHRSLLQFTIKQHKGPLLDQIVEYRNVRGCIEKYIR